MHGQLVPRKSQYPPQGCAKPSTSVCTLEPSTVSTLSLTSTHLCYEEGQDHAQASLDVLKSKILCAAAPVGPEQRPLACHPLEQRNQRLNYAVNCNAVVVAAHLLRQRCRPG